MLSLAKTTNKNHWRILNKFMNLYW